MKRWKIRYVVAIELFLASLAPLLCVCSLF